MLRRRPDLSWPLIGMLVGLFLLSLHMPREWERIARDSRLALQASSAAPPIVSPSTSGLAAPQTPDTTDYSVIASAGPVGKNLAIPAASAPESASGTVSLPSVAKPASQAMQASVEQAHIAEAAIRHVHASDESQLAVQAVAQSESEAPEDRNEKASEVRILKDVPETSKAKAVVVVDRDPADIRGGAIAATIPEPSTTVAEPSTEGNPLPTHYMGAPLAESGSTEGPAFGTTQTATRESPSAEQDVTAADPLPVRPVAPEPRANATATIAPPSRRTKRGGIACFARDRPGHRGRSSQVGPPG